MKRALLLASLAAACVRGKARPAADAGAPPPPAQARELPEVAKAWLAEPLPRAWPAKRPGGELRVWLSYEPTTLDALLEQGYAQQTISLGLVQEGLLRVDPGDPDKVLPALAEKLDVSAGGRVMIAHLAPARFSDGQPVTALDVAFTVAAARAPANLAEAGALLEPLDHAEVVDQRTVKLVWKEPYAFAERVLALVPILPAHAFKGPGAVRGAEAGRIPIGTGPYRVERWDEGERVVLVRSETHVGEAPALARIVFRRATPDVALELLRKGELDVIHTVYNERQFAALAEDDAVRARFRAMAFYDGSYMSVILDCARGPLADPRVREALALSFDYEGHREAVGMGLPRLTRCPLYAGTPDCDETLPPPHRDLARARALLAAAGFANQRVPLGFLVPSHWKVPTWEIFERDAGEAGFDLALERADMAAVARRWREGAFDASAYLQFGFFDPARRYRTGGAENFMRFSDPVSDRLLDALDRERDPQKRHALARRFTGRFDALHPQILLWSRPWLSVVSRRFANTVPTRAFFQYAQWWRAD